MRMGIRKQWFPVAPPAVGVFFNQTDALLAYPDAWKVSLRQRADAIHSGRLRWFSIHEFDVGLRPDWFRNPFTARTLVNPSKHWTELSDFGLETGDVKIIWEPSRFDWITDLARAYRVFGDEKYLTQLNTWLSDWSVNNPPNIGPNWKCGQETSFRVMKLMHAALVVKQWEQPSEVLQGLVIQHLARVEGNIGYSVAQDNNHGTSESAALWIGSAWVLKYGANNEPTRRRLQSWARKGRSIWKGRLLKLIAKDGSFSQRSVNYHRVVVDTASFVLFYAERLSLSLTVEELERLEQLVSWQYKFIIPETGDAPNLGANDGAMIENLHGCGYRDFRASCQLAHWMLYRERVFDSGPWDETIFWRCPDSWNSFPVVKRELHQFEILDEQYLILRNGGTHVFLRIPDDRFRPLANDAFHLDVWHRGANLIIGSGSYSYNSDEPFAGRFKSVMGHNTVQFGNHDQMPRISKFLLAKWIKADAVSLVTAREDVLVWEGSYTDAWANRHTRLLILENNGQLTVTDRLDTQESWCLRYQMNSSWVELSESDCKTDRVCMELSGKHSSLNIERGYSSLHYLQCTETEVLRVDGFGSAEVSCRIVPFAPAKE